MDPVGMECQPKGFEQFAFGISLPKPLASMVADPFNAVTPLAERKMSLADRRAPTPPHP